MPPNNQLPSSLESKVARTRSTNTDKNLVLREKLESTQNALEEANSQLTELHALNELLRDNSKIKSDAVWYAKIFMILVPLVCVFLLLSQIIDGVEITWGGSAYSLKLQRNFDGIAQTSLIVGPLVFLATVLGLLLRGVFGQSSENREGGLLKFARTLDKPE